MLIAGDIGGTKTELALFSRDGGPHAPIAQTKVPSADFPDLESLVNQFLSTVKDPVDSACFAVAGPVINGRVKTTNLPWTIDQSTLQKELGLKSVSIINDLEAIAWAIPGLQPGDFVTINPGEPVPQGVLGVIAPGTGLGESFLTWDGTRYQAHPSEGGHADFAPVYGRQIRLLEYMLTKFDHVSYEHVCSGIGIPNIYRFLRDVEGMKEQADMAALVASGRDPAHLIIEREVSCELCAATIEMFASILAAEAGNLALKMLATGGIYIAGGVAVHTVDVLSRPPFLESFKRKGRFADFLSRIPIHVVVSHAGLAGAAAHGLQFS